MSATSHTGDHSESGLLSLLPSSVNFILFVAFIVWKFKKPIQEYFVELSKTTKQLHQNALKGFEEASKVFQDAQGVKDNVEKVNAQFIQLQEKSLQEYKVNLQKNAKEKLEKVNLELEMRLENLRSQLSLDIKERFIDSIIQEVSQKVTADPKNSQQLTGVLMKDFNL